MFPAYATLPDKIGWYLLRGVGVLVLLFLLCAETPTNPSAAKDTTKIIKV